eukprot:tig00001278_g7994.t1
MAALGARPFGCTTRQISFISDCGQKRASLSEFDLLQNGSQAVVEKLGLSGPVALFREFDHQGKDLSSFFYAADLDSKAPADLKKARDFFRSSQIGYVYRAIMRSAPSADPESPSRQPAGDPLLDESPTSRLDSPGEAAASAPASSPAGSTPATRSGRMWCEDDGEATASGDRIEQT